MSNSNEDKIFNKVEANTKLIKNLKAPECHKSCIHRNEECPICFKELKDSNKVVTPCGHAFGWKCIFRWYNRGNKTCPLCRSELGQVFIT